MASEKDTYHGISSKSPKERAILLWTAATLVIVGLHIYTNAELGGVPYHPVEAWQVTLSWVTIIATSIYGVPVAFALFFGYVHFSTIVSVMCGLFVRTGSIHGWKEQYKDEMENDY